MTLILFVFCVGIAVAIPLGFTLAGVVVFFTRNATRGTTGGGPR